MSPMVPYLSKIARPSLWDMVLLSSQNSSRESRLFPKSSHSPSHLLQLS